MITAALTRAARLRPSPPPIVDLIECRHCGHQWTLGRYHALPARGIDLLACVEKRQCTCGGIVAFAWEVK